MVTTFPKDALWGGPGAQQFTASPKKSYWSDSIAMPILQETHRRGKAHGYKLVAESGSNPGLTDPGVFIRAPNGQMVSPRVSQACG